jgi:hypothetical protein
MGRAERFDRNWRGDFCISPKDYQSHKTAKVHMDQLFVGTTFLYVAPITLIVFVLIYRYQKNRKMEVVRAEWDRQAKILLPELTHKYASLNSDEVSKLMFAEIKKGDAKDSALVLALGMLMDQKRLSEPDTKSTNTEIDSPDHFWAHFSIGTVGIFLITSAVLYAFTLIIPALVFSFGFVAIVTTLIVIGYLLFSDN